jgi:DNA topoisomerase-2
MTKTIEEKYKKLTQREHALSRPGMYIGDTSKKVEEQWSFDGASGKMMKRFVEFTPALLKIFDEVLTNATDHATRDATLNAIKVDVNKETGEISVWNNGVGIPIVIHKEHNIYVPELIFGHLLSGSNYDDSEKRIGSGLNGLGVKLANIYSKRFVVETVDASAGLKFTQEYSDNMSVVNKPKVVKSKGNSYTKIIFTPDYQKFGMNDLEDDTISLMQKRVYDCMVCTNKDVGIYFNGEKLKGKGLTDYIKYFFEDESKIFYENLSLKEGGINFQWEVAVVPWEKFEHVSFVNGNSTYTGGTHVDAVVGQITKRLKTLLETKKKLADVKPAMIRERMFLFLRATVVNPQFSSQTKEHLITQSSKFGCKVDVSDKFIDKIWKSSIVEEIIEVYKMKESIDLAKKTDGVKRSKLYIPKLEDALWAGTAKSNQCTLILTEGLSAQTFALWGRSIVGNEKFGVFPLKGKLLNVRDATVQQLMNNEEINNLKQIVGLKQGKEYKDTSDLRYGRVMALCDSDDDGTHIKSLFVNWIHAHYPSLAKLNFIQTLRTPIIKAIKGKRVLEFFNEQDYRKWNDTMGDDASSYHIRYFKGLGTSQKEDAKDAFRRFDELKVDYYYKDENCDDAIELAFEKDKNIKKIEGSEYTSCSDKRKEWLKGYDRNSYIEVEQGRVSYSELINKELIHFSIYDNTRSIPSLCDGLKPSQRKILYYMLNNNITKTIKVAQLSGYVSAKTGYHHGEASLQQAIVGMAQDFVGSNNINLLFPDGNHGSRNNGGKDAASARYIYTYLSQLAPMIFNQSDTPLLPKQYDDGQEIEPEWLMPVLPMVLVNGCEGIGTGYSTYIPPHNPKDIIANIHRVMDGKKPLPMKPWFKGFRGSVENNDDGNYTIKGKWEKISDYQIQITELPVGTWVSPYKEFLESMIEGVVNKRDTTPKPKRKIVLKDVKNKTTDENTGICFVVEFKSSEQLQTLINSGQLEKELKLSKNVSLSNMYLFDDNLIPSKYTNTNDILLDFYNLRIGFYGKRKEYLINKLQEELVVLDAKVRFISEYTSGKLNINNVSKDDIFKKLQKTKYPTHPIEGGYDFLMKMPLYSLTKERIEDLQQSAKKKREELACVKAKTTTDLWKEDLNAILKSAPQNN